MIFPILLVRKIHAFISLRLFSVLSGFLLLFLLIVPGPSHSASLTMETHLGFNGRFSLNRWTPLHVVMENRGRNVSGVLEVVVTSGSEYLGDVHDTLYYMDIEIATHSKKQYEFTIYLESFVHPLIVRLRQAGDTIVSHSINLRQQYTNKSLALFLDARLEHSALSMLPKKLQPVFSRSGFFPTTWYGLDGVEMILVNADVFLNFSEAQFSALEAWIERGGYIIISGSLNYGSLLHRAMKSLMPLKVLGTKKIADLNSLETFCGKGLTSTGPFLILRTFAEEASILLEEDDIPIILRQDRGLGSIVFTAFDFLNSPFWDWPGQTVFWEKIYSIRPIAERPSLDLDVRTAMDSMLSSIPARSPRYGPSIFFIALYLILVLSLFYLFTKARSGRWKLFMALISTIVIFNIGAFVLFFNKNAGNDPSFNSLLYLRLSGNHGIGPGQFILGLYSLSKRDIHISSAEHHIPFTAIIPETLGEDTPRILTLHQRSGKQTLEVHFEKWSHHFLKAEASLGLPFRGEAFLDGKDLIISIKNGSRLPIPDCLIYFDDRFIQLEEILPQEDETMRLAGPFIEKTPTFKSEGAEKIIKGLIPRIPDTLLERLQEDIMKDLLEAIASRYETRRDRLLILGWIGAHGIPLNFDTTSIVGEGVVLFEWEIPVKDLKRSL